MALIKCPECGKEISDKAEKCICCGHYFTKPKSISKTLKAAITIVSVILILIIALISVNFFKLK